MKNALTPARMSTQDRLAEIAALLSDGFLRLDSRTALSAETGDISLDFERHESGPAAPDKEAADP